MSKSDAYTLLAELHKSGNEDALAILETELGRPRIDPPAPISPTPPGPFDNVDWHKLFQTIATAILTLVVVPVMGYYGYSLPNNVADARQNAAEARTNAAAAITSADAAAQHAQRSTAEAAAARTEAQAAAATATKAVSGVADSLANVASKVEETKKAADAARLSADAAAKPKPLMPLNLPKE